MARKLIPNELAAAASPEQKETASMLEQKFWFEKIEEQRDAILNMSPELRAWFGERFTPQDL
jgi:hypothetical protein